MFKLVKTAKSYVHVCDVDAPDFLDLGAIDLAPESFGQPWPFSLQARRIAGREEDGAPLYQERAFPRTLAGFLAAVRWVWN